MIRKQIDAQRFKGRERHGNSREHRDIGEKDSESGVDRTYFH